jgi:hypothetical protein
MSRRTTVGVTALFAGLGILAAYGVSAQQPDRGRPEQRQGGPRPEMLQACASKAAGDACSATGRQGGSIAGICLAPEGRPLACRPQGGRPPAGGPDGGDQQGETIPETRANTSAILCGFSVEASNATLGIKSVAQWSCGGGVRTLTANGIPEHAVGVFPNAANPNRISAQTVSFSATTSPVARTGAGFRVKEPGFAINGVKFDPGTAGRCPSGVTNTRQCDLGRGIGEWSIEALGQSSFDFGVDASNAHVQPTGAYHYHGVPEGLMAAAAKVGRAMALVGWASDGFPIYARYGHADAKSLGSPLRVMRGSYQVNSTPDPGRPEPRLIPMGAFEQDYHFVAKFGDLDECNGRFGVTPEFPNGVYHYYATDSYPFVQRCVKGAPGISNLMGPPDVRPPRGRRP